MSRETPSTAAPAHRRARLGQNLDLRDLGKLAEHLPASLRGRTQAAFNTAHGSAVQWLRSEMLLAEYLAKHLCDLVCTAYLMGFEDDTGADVADGVADRSLRHGALELELRRMEDAQAAARRRATKGRAPKGFSFGEYVGVLRTAAIDKAASMEIHAALPDLHTVLSAKVPTEALRLVKHLKAVQDGRKKFEIPAHKVGAFAHERCEPLQGTARFHDVMSAIVEIRNRLAHPGAAAAPAQSGAGGQDGWWMDASEFVGFFAERIGNALVALLTWEPMAALLSQLEAVTVQDARPGGWAVARPGHPASLLDADSRTVLEPPPGAVLSPGQRVLAQRVPDRPYALVAQGPWVSFPRSRWTNELHREDYRRLFVDRLTDDGQITGLERNELVDLRAELKLSKEVCDIEEHAVLRRLHQLLVALEPPSGLAAGDETEDAPVSEATPAGSDTGTERDLSALKQVLRDPDWVPTTEGADRPPLELAAVEQARALGEVIHRNAFEIVRELRQVTPHMVAQVSGLSAELASWSLQHLARDGAPSREIRALDRGADVDGAARQLQRYVFVDVELVGALEELLRTSTALLAAKDREEIPASLLYRACRVAHSALMADSSSDEVHALSSTMSILKQLAAAQGSEDGGGASLQVVVAGKAVQAPHLSLLFQLLAQELGSEGVRKLPEHLELSAARYVLSTGKVHPDGRPFGYPIELKHGRASRWVEGSLSLEILAFHLTAALTRLGHDIGAWEGDAPVDPALLELARSGVEEPREPQPPNPSRDRGVRVYLRGGPDADTPAPLDIVGSTVPAFLERFLLEADRRGWLHSAMRRRAGEDDGDPRSASALELPVPMGYVRVALSHTPCTLKGQAMTRPVSVGGVYMEAAITWEAALQVVTELLLEPSRLGVTTGPDSPATRLAAITPEGDGPIAVAVPGRLKAEFKARSVEDLLRRVLEFVENDPKFALPEVPFVVGGRAVVAASPEHPDGTPFWRPVDVTLGERPLFVEACVSSRDARFQVRALLRAARCEADEPARARKPRIWALAPGRGAELWGEWLDRGVGALGWAEVEDLSTYLDKGEVEQVLMALSGSSGRQFNSANALADFAHRVEPGDIFVAKAGVSRVVGWGVVASGYRFSPQTSADMPHERTVDWQAVDVSLDTRLPLKTFTDITRHLDMLRHLSEAVPPIAELFTSGVLARDASGEPTVDEDLDDAESMGVEGEEDTMDVLAALEPEPPTGSEGLPGADLA